MTYTLIIPEQLQVTPEQFAQLAIANRDLRLEQTATGELIVTALRAVLRYNLR